MVFLLLAIVLVGAGVILAMVFLAKDKETKKVPVNTPELNLQTTPASSVTIVPISAPIRIFYPGQIAWASFIGGLLAGFILFALNYRAYGNSSTARKFVIYGIVSQAILIALGFILPKFLASLIAPLAQVPVSR